MFNQLKDVISYNESFLAMEEANKLFDHLMGYHELTSMMELETATGESIKYNFGHDFID